MNITEKYLGNLSQDSIFLYTLVNDNNINISILSYGGTIMEIALPDKDTGLRTITLTLKNWEDYIHNPLYPGSSLGPNAGRIRNGEMTIGSNNYQLSQNDGRHHLHGGVSSVSYQNWILKEQIKGKNFVSLTLSTVLTDGQEGYPGNREISASYTLDNAGRFIIQYSGVSDRDTYFNLSNHTYINLSGLNTSGLSQILTIEANSYIANNEEHLPLQVLPVENSPFDFGSPVSLKDNLESYPNHPQTIIARGYNNGFDIRNAALRNTPAVTLWDSAHTAGLKLYTNAPCLVLYSGGFIGSEYRLKNNTPTHISCAIALEAQDFPDALHLGEGSDGITLKGERYLRRIVYEFSY